MIRWSQLSLFDFLKPSAPASEPEPQIVARPRLRQGWRLEWKRGEGARLSVPPALLQAPEEIHSALLEWSGIARRGRRVEPETGARRRDLEKRVFNWLENHRLQDPDHRIRDARKAERHLARLQGLGKHHDLAAIFAAVNAEYFGGRLEARITWSRRWGGLSTHSIRKDGQGNPYNLITISRGYDHPSAASEIVGGVVHHECLHIVLPPKEGRGKRIVHGREFRRMEKQYRHYDAWRKWHREVLPRILRRGG